MRTEVPVLHRCCFCIPLRPGLIAWGYFKLAIACSLVLLSLYGLHQVVTLYVTHKLQTLIVYIIIFMVLLVLSIIDVVLHVFFIIGGHKKQVKFLKVYNYYGIVLLVLTFLMGLVTAGLTIVNMDEYYTEDSVLLFTSDLGTTIFNMLIQGYIVVLVRSEIVKLQNRNSFRFVNNAADAECTLNIEDIGDQAEEKDKNIHNED